ncbi:cation-translocating P-type ATPase [Paucibacter sp. PLA-PC-4]|uniref:heavy metal translocating P-type ATPase n=1 Tax=Paucibacter sp. PLA-PC-4 TaxID=2993655 RepID=UPI00224B9014|nr:cation-translocating P-type ATPase [Paucibacter sp. PLA-PC-4]MCX2864217.1 cation-translocating P-type ATPase [Paucibacter sp. PLA-PC-4]
MSASTLTESLPAGFGRPELGLTAGSEVIDQREAQAAFTEWSGEDRATSQLRLAGMHCAACAGIIERTLLAEPGVLGAEVHAAAERLQLRWNPQQVRLSQLLGAVARAGYEAQPDVAAPARQLRQREKRRALWRLFVAGFLMMQVMMLAWPIYVAAPGEMSADLQHLLNWGAWVLSLPVLLFSAGPFFASAWHQLRQRRLGMDVPVSLGIAVTFVASSGATFDPGGPFGHEVYFDSLTMFVCFLLAGRWLELCARHRVAEELERATAGLPDWVERIEPDGSSSRVSPALLRVGDLLRIAAGQAFAADGRIEQGRSEADEALLSGESRPVPKTVGDEVVAGSINLSGSLLVRVLRVGADTRFDAIVRLMRKALTQRPAELRLADRVAGPFLWTVLALAAGAALVWSQIDPQRAVWVAVSVLIVTCPCALSLAAPSAWLAAAAALARRGMLLARLDMLERLALVDTIVLDKTGTLTEEGMVLLQSWPAEPGALIAEAAALAQHSQHVFARALAAATAAAPTDWRDVQELPGRGLQALDAGGQVWRLGAPAWVAEGQVLPKDSPLPEAQLCFGRPGESMLLLQFGEVLRADAREAVARLHEQGLRTLLLSGDAPERAAAMAARAGITAVQGGASPEDKLATVTQLQAEGRRVLMLGDGINDAPVLARADVSLAMGQGALIARAQADGVLLSGRLVDVALARALALRTRRVIRQNLGWAALYNATCIPLALAGLLPPWAAGLGMAASSLLVVMNAYRLRR